MADVRRPISGHQPPVTGQRVAERSPNPTQLVGFLTLIVSGGILLLLTGLTVIGLAMGLIFFSPLLFITSPIWVPLGALLLVGVAGTLSLCGFGVAVLSAASWLYRHFKGFDKQKSGRVDYARNRIYDAASSIKDYAKEYGEYAQSKAKDTAPGA